MGDVRGPVSKEQTEKTPLLAGLYAARANVLPGLFIQSVMLAIVLAYYHHAPTTSVLSTIGDWKYRYGYGFAFLVTGVAGGIIPEILRILILQRGVSTRENLINVLFGFPFWGFMGCCVDVFYRGQALWFGTAATAAVLAKKVAVDQLIYTPLWGLPAVVWAYEWKRRGFSFRGLGRMFTPAFYRTRIIPAALAGWSVWVPALCIIYSLPPLLQIPLFALATSFWSLIITYMSGTETAPAGVEAQTASSAAS